jgi:hypothetical protein
MDDSREREWHRLLQSLDAVVGAEVHEMTVADEARAPVPAAARLPRVGRR